MVGYRAWDLSVVGMPGDYQRFRISSIIMKGELAIWKADMVASCFYGEVAAHLRNPGLSEGHLCGIYSLKTLDSVIKEFSFSSFGVDIKIYGSIYNYGTVLEGTLGFRSSRARVMSFIRIDIPCCFCGLKSSSYLLVEGSCLWSACELCTKILGTRLLPYTKAIEIISLDFVYLWLSYTYGEVPVVRK